MNKMTKAEIVTFIKSCAWGTLIGVEGDKPYAVEVSYGTDGDYLYCGSMPGGRMARCLQANPNVVFKICTSDRNAETFQAVIIEGKAERLTAFEDILHSLSRVARHVGLDEHALDPIAKRHCQNPGSNFIRIPLSVVDGILRAGGTFKARSE
jgi:nitroimidazol reductase NimA-like FMN-containing flavoprotein (pyridoxamine 5'-phosphate oxidase superfamily)